MKKLIQDRLGDAILVVDDFCADRINEDTTDEYQDYSMVLENPSIIFELENDSSKRFYFKRIAHDKTMLIGLIRVNRHFEICECRINPSDNLLMDLINRASKHRYNV